MRKPREPPVQRWSQAVGNNQVPRDIVLGRNTCGSHMRCPACERAQWCCVHFAELGIHPQVPREREDDIRDYTRSVGNYPPRDSLREQAAQALQPDSGTRLQPRQPATALGAGGGRKGTLTVTAVTVDNHLRQEGSYVYQERPTTTIVTYTPTRQGFGTDRKPYNRGNRWKGSPRNRNRKRSVEAEEFRGHFLDS